MTHNDRRIAGKAMFSAFMNVVIIIALAVFIALYAEEKTSIQEKYKTQLKLNLDDAYSQIDDYQSRNVDYQVHYNMLLSDLGAARSIAFMIENYENYQKILTEFHYVFVKYPEQSGAKLDSAKEAIQMVSVGNNDGYMLMKEFVDSIDKKGS